MKINAITPKPNSVLSKKKLQQENKAISNPVSKNELSNDCSNVAFLGTKKTLNDVKNLRVMKRNFSPEAQAVYDKAVELAKNTNSKEIETWHFYLASLYTLKEYISELDDGSIVHEEQKRLKTPFEIESMITPTAQVFGDEKHREKIAKIVDEHIEYVLDNFKPKEVASKIKTPFLSTPVPSKEAIGDLCETYDLLATQLQTNNFPDSYFHIAGHYSNDKKLLKEAKTFITDVQAAVMVVDENKKKKNHLKFYDDKADTIWKNLNIGNDAICLYSSNDRESSQHLISSFVNLINKPNQVYKNINPDNTQIVELNNDASFEFLNEILHEAKTSPAYKDMTVVFVANMIDLIKNANGQLNEFDIKTILNENANKKGDNRNIRLVFMITPESYYANTAKGSGLAYPLSHYAVQTLPSLNAADAINFLTDNEGLKYVENETKEHFSKDTIIKAVELTAQDDGNYPEKAISLLANTKRYFIDKKEITKEDLEKFISETHGLNEVNSSQDSTDVVFDTGKSLSDIKGSPMTKADAEAIANQIKTGTIGTKGYSIFLDNGTSYGGGRKHTAQAIAGEAKIPMITINAQDFALKDIDTLSQNANYSEMKIKKIVSLAKAQAEANKNKTAMIFIENFDNFASNPLYGVSSIYEQKAFSQLQSEMDNARKNDDINLIVVGSVNMPELIDMNIMKPYKFLDSIVVYPPQDSNERKEVLEYYIDNMKLNLEGDEAQKQKTIEDISETTEGFSVVDLMYLLETAKGVMLERGKDAINSSDLIEAFLRTTSGRPNKAYVPDGTKKVVASHEAGHALTLQIMNEIAQKENVEQKLPNTVNFITLDPRANFGGAMYYKTPNNNNEYSFERIFADIVCSYGGHSCEKEIYGMSGSWGITGDMQSAESMARMAVLDMGMGPRTGVCHVRRNALNSPDVSQEKLRLIEQDIDSMHKSAKYISDDIVRAYKDFILEFTQKHYQKVATGDCLVSSQDFVADLNAWREKQPESKQKELLQLEKDIVEEINRVKEGR